MIQYQHFMTEVIKLITTSPTLIIIHCHLTPGSHWSQDTSGVWRRLIATEPGDHQKWSISAHCLILTEDMQQSVFFGLHF